MLSEMAWSKVENCFGPHSVDLMSLDSNAMKYVDGEPLRHFTPWLTPHASGCECFLPRSKKGVESLRISAFWVSFPSTLSFKGTVCVMYFGCSRA